MSFAPARTLCFSVAAVAFAIAWPAAPARAQQDDFEALREASVVTGAAKYPQPLSETPSSVSVITASEIRANGYHTLGEAMRWVRGVFVTDDRNYTYIGVRGLLRPGDYNDKVLLAIDGHTVNGSVYGDALFGEELGLDLEDVERIEVVRGPSSSLYGSFAALALVNVVTRAPHATPGATAAGRVGGEGERRGYARIASAAPGRPEWALSGSWLASSGSDLYFPAYDSPSTSFGRAMGLDGERGGAALFSALWGSWRLAAKFNERTKDIPTGAFETRFGDHETRSVDGHDFVELSGEHRPAPTLQLDERVFWDGSRYHGRYPYGPDSARIVNFDEGNGDAVGAEVRAHWAVTPGHLVTTGVEGQDLVRVRLLNYDVAPRVLYTDVNAHWTVGACYAQDEMRLGSATRLTAGARVDGQDARLKAVVSPRLDLVTDVARHTRFKLLGGTAFRAPSPYETEVSANGVSLNPGLLPERLGTVEGVIEHERGPWTLIATGYRTSIRDRIDLVSVDSAGYSHYGNVARAASHGLEGEADRVASAGSRLRLAVAWQETWSVPDGAPLTNSPAWNAFVQYTHAPPDARTTFGVGIRYLSSRLTLAGNRTAAAYSLDARIARAVAPSWWLGVQGLNLTDARYGDPASTEHLEDEIPQAPRRLFLSLEWQRRSAP